RQMDEILLANFHVFLDVVQAGAYDLWVGDEAWEVDHYLHENPELKTAPFAWLTDFVGFLPMVEGDGGREAFVVADYNAEMIEQVERFPRVRDAAVYIGRRDEHRPRSVRTGTTAPRPVAARSLRPERLRALLRPRPPRRPRRPACRLRLLARGARGGGGRGRHERGRIAAEAPSVGVPRGAGGRAGPEAGGRVRAAHRPGVDAARGWRRVPRLRPRPLPDAGRRRRGTRPGRPLDDDGARRRPRALPLLPARSALRAEPARRPPPGALRGALLGARDLRRCRAGAARRQDLAAAGFAACVRAGRGRRRAAGRRADRGAPVRPWPR